MRLVQHIAAAAALILASASATAAIYPAPTTKTTIATTDPAASNDASQGYVVGSIWTNTTSGTQWVAQAVTAGAAVWVSQSAANATAIAAMDVTPKRAQTYNLLQKLSQGLVDAAIYTNSDSTGISTDSNIGEKWIKLLGRRLAAAYPAYSVVYYGWSGSNYLVGETLQTGSGSRVLRIYNAATAGVQSVYMMGARFQAAYVTPGFQADLVILNHGHNQDYVPDPMRGGRLLLLAGLDPILRYHPQAGVIVVAQNPDRDDTNGTNRSQAAAYLAQTRGYDLLDFRALFLSANKPASWYYDNVHPSAAGNAAMVDWAWSRLFTNIAGQSRVEPPALGRRASNLLTNADFASVSAGAATGWTVTGATLAANTTAGNFETAGQSAQLTTNGSTTSYIEQAIGGDTVVKLRGQTVTLAVRWLAPMANQVATSGMPEIFAYNGSANSASSLPPAIPYNSGVRDGFVWQAVSFIVPLDAITITFRINAARSFTSTGAVEYLDRAWAGAGYEPSDLP